MFGLFRKGSDRLEEEDFAGNPKGMPKSNMVILPENQRENLEADLSVLADTDGRHEERLQKVAAQEVRNAAEDSIRKIQKINMGRCPVCGEHLVNHLTANICESCGWNQYDTPRDGECVVHLAQGGEVKGDHVYLLKGGDCLVMSNGIVSARVPQASCLWVEYRWPEAELESRKKQYAAQLTDMQVIKCGWCGEACNVNSDGFHLVHVAFGNSQERYCFCSDDCFEAFRKMYPARVHRDCYDRNCNECDLCTKRYSDEAEGIRTLAKDRLIVKPKETKQN